MLDLPGITTIARRYGGTPHKNTKDGVVKVDIEFSTVKLAALFASHVQSEVGAVDIRRGDVVTSLDEMVTVTALLLPNHSQRKV